MYNQKGFTLIEVMVVIIMIGILAAVAIPIYSGYVYRARASEGIAMLGAMKTFALEHRTSRGSWPVEADFKDAFHNFNELFYFNPSVIIYKNGDRFALRINADKDTFGYPDGLDDTAYLQIDFAIATVDKSQIGWSGGIKTEYAKHLPPCTAPLSS